MRKDNGYEVSDRIIVKVTPNVEIDNTLLIFKKYICSEILADDMRVEEYLDAETTDLNGIEIKITIQKV